MTHFFTLVLCLVGFAALACATNRQQRDLFGGKLPPQVTVLLRFIGTCALLAAFALLASTYGVGLGLVMLSGHCSLAAALVYCSLIIQARRSVA